MKTILFTLFVTLISCDTYTERYEKPFIIIDKNIYDGCDEVCECYYRFQDNKNKISYFTDFNYAYNIGDTIK